jgi:hypothetical protein
VPESFKIKPSLKKIVTEISDKSFQEGNKKISKGDIYNFLIEKGLELING